MKKAFTLLELLLVISIMGLMGTVSVGAYRAMQRGMEERGVVQNVNEFFRLAYERAQIDNTPVVIYMWNETLSDEERSDNSELIVIGKAVAVRGFGRITKVDGDRLVDEFGDLRALAERNLETDEIVENPSASVANNIYLYQLKGNSGMQRTKVSQTTSRYTINEPVIVDESVGTAGDDDSGRGDSLREFEAFAYVMAGGSGGAGWKAGDRYGLEFAQLSLPHNYIFGNDYSKSADNNNIRELSQYPYMAPGTAPSGYAVQLCALRQGKSGDMTVVNLGTVKDPSQSRRNSR